MTVVRISNVHVHVIGTAITQIASVHKISVECVCLGEAYSGSSGQGYDAPRCQAVYS